jgi:hypothetical protein
MDRMYLKQTIENLQEERGVHDKKFADNPAHKNCLPNFDAAIEKLNQELVKLDEQEQLQK